MLTFWLMNEVCAISKCIGMSLCVRSCVRPLILAAANVKFLVGPLFFDFPESRITCLIFDFKVLDATFLRLDKLGRFQFFFLREREGEKM